MTKQVDRVEELARMIILSHTEDIEYLTVSEMVGAEVEDLNLTLTDEQVEELTDEVDQKIREAKLIVKFSR